jgi:hypothetical protein
VAASFFRLYPLTPDSIRWFASIPHDRNCQSVCREVKRGTALLKEFSVEPGNNGRLAEFSYTDGRIAASGNRERPRVDNQMTSPAYLLIWPLRLTQSTAGTKS